MHKKYFILIPVLALGFIHYTFAAQITFTAEPNTTKTAVVDAYVDPQGKNINVVEGDITFQSSSKVDVKVLNGNSILTIWPTLPTYSADKKTVSFTGGIPGGTTKQGLLFQMRITPDTAGPVTISTSNADDYLNDGLGTSETIAAQPLTINFNQTQTNTNNNWWKYGIIILIIISMILITLVVRKKHEK